MSKGNSSLPARRWGILAVVALLGLTVAFSTASAGASVWQPAGAVSAKKKCKKKHRSASSAKKKCKKRKAIPAPAPAPVPTPQPPPKPPITRAEVTWSGDAEIDVHAWSTGLHVGWSNVVMGDEIEIPGFTYEPSSSASERIIDSANPSTIPLSFGICNFGDPTGGTTQVSVHVVLADGTVDDDVLPADPGDAFTDTLSQGGARDPFADWC